MLSSSVFTGAAGSSGLFSDPIALSPVNRKRIDSYLHAHAHAKRVRFRADVKVRLRPSASNLRPLSRLAAKKDTGEISEPPIAALDDWDVAWREYMGEFYDDYMHLSVPRDDPIKLRRYTAAREQLAELAKQLLTAQKEWAAGMQAADQAELDAVPIVEGPHCVDYRAQMIGLLASRATVLTRLVSAAQRWQEIETRRWRSASGDFAVHPSGTPSATNRSDLFVSATPQGSYRKGDDQPGGSLPPAFALSIYSLDGAGTSAGGPGSAYVPGRRHRQATDSVSRQTCGDSTSSIRLISHDHFCEFVDQVDAFQKKYKRLCDSIRRVQRKAYRQHQLQGAAVGLGISRPTNTTPATPATLVTTSALPTFGGARPAAAATIGSAVSSASSFSYSNNNATGPSPVTSPGTSEPMATRMLPTETAAGGASGTGTPLQYQTSGSATGSIGTGTRSGEAKQAGSGCYPGQPTVSASRPSLTLLGSSERNCGSGMMRMVTATVAKKSSSNDLGRFAFPPLRRRAGSTLSAASPTSWVSTSLESSDDGDFPDDPASAAGNSQSKLSLRPGSGTVAGSEALLGGLCSWPSSSSSTTSTSTALSDSSSGSFTAETRTCPNAIVDQPVYPLLPPLGCGMRSSSEGSSSAAAAFLTTKEAVSGRQAHGRQTQSARGTRRSSGTASSNNPPHHPSKSLPPTSRIPPSPRSEAFSHATACYYSLN